ncbi:MAG: ribosomal protein S18-alanine N-acetyltransferase [Clostridiales bacterium]|nr:ribosomal protein S18-alanine N-acetyltransferase [Clostridiales bacterium]
MSISIQPAKEEWINLIVSMENECFTDPWSERSLLEEIQKGRLFCAVWQEKPIGYLVMWPVADEYEIASVAVHPCYRRQGVASLLLQYALSQEGAAYYLEVRESNASARALYAKYGFREYGRRKNYYHKPVEDAILLSRC